MDFATVWLPNIVCTFGGIVVSGLVGFWHGRRVARASEKHTRMLTNLLIVMEERGYLKLVRNEQGEVTGGRAYEMKLEAGVRTVADVQATVIRGQAPPPANQP